MRVHHLFESTDDALTKIWEGGSFRSLITSLELSDDEDHKMLARMVEASVTKHAKSSPQRLFSTLKPLIRAAAARADGHHPALTTVITSVVGVALKDIPMFQALTSKVSIEDLQPFLTSKQKVQLKLLNQKLGRTPEEEQYDEEQELFVFIGRPSFKEVPPGSGSYHKTLEIEQLIKVDGYDAEAHHMVQMMRFRARHQGDNSEVYSIRLPKGTIHGRTTSHLDDYLVDLIDKHKQVVR